MSADRGRAIDRLARFPKSEISIRLQIVLPYLSFAPKLSQLSLSLPSLFPNSSSAQINFLLLDIDDFIEDRKISTIGCPIIGDDPCDLSRPLE